ncbi:MAG: hypothetical protein KatS3mg089_0900 [Patescibacteria group bacterium]|nr:MAG: hypothetical protein KatS3mg089_0900 [Patescibacteria group bacterium]
MPRASRFPIPSILAKEMMENIFNLFSSLSSKDNAQVVYREFFTKEEQTMISKRLMVFMLLEKGYTTSQIANLIGVSKEMVRVSELSWAEKDNQFKDLIRQVIKQSEKGKLWEHITELLKPLDLALQAKNDMQSRAKLYQGDIT